VRGIDKIPKAPKHLPKIAKEEWKRLAKELFESGKLTKENIKALELYCKNYSVWRECEDTIDIDGRIAVAQSGYKMQHPAVSIGNKAQDAMMKWLKVLRDTHPVKKKQNDPLAEFMRGGKKLKAVK